MNPEEMRREVARMMAAGVPEEAITAWIKSVQAESAPPVPKFNPGGRSRFTPEQIQARADRSVAQAKDEESASDPGYLGRLGAIGSFAVEQAVPFGGKLQRGLRASLEAAKNRRFLPNAVDRATAEGDIMVAQEDVPPWARRVAKGAGLALGASGAEQALGLAAKGVGKVAARAAPVVAKIAPKVGEAGLVVGRIAGRGLGMSHRTLDALEGVARSFGGKLAKVGSASSAPAKVAAQEVAESAPAAVSAVASKAKDVAKTVGRSKAPVDRGVVTVADAAKAKAARLAGKPHTAAETARIEVAKKMGLGEVPHGVLENGKAFLFWAKQRKQMLEAAKR